MKNILLAIFILLIISGFAQDSLVISFYNVENLFDTINAPYKNDEEYLPTSKTRWNTERYNQKLTNISKTILALNHWKGADIIGLCEVENRNVLQDLTTKTSLKQHHYQIIHYEAPDKRGIDVAMLYKTDKFTPISSEGIEVVLPDKHPTRLILYVQGTNNKGDTLHLFFNHWSSRRGGEIASYPNRIAFSEILQKRIQLIIQNNSKAKIIISGDFNDEIHNESVQNLIQKEKLLHALSFEEKTHKYQNEWHQFDIFLLSPIFNQLKFDAKVFKMDWLMEKDTQFLGEKPFRTFQGKKYLGGYSDHLPIKMVFYF